MARMFLEAVPQRLLLLGRYFLLGILFVSLNGHLALLQTLAWGNMLVSYSQQASLAEAAQKTFDGEHPCSLCKVVSESKKQEKKKPLLKAEIKLDVTLPVAVGLADIRGRDFVVQLPVYAGADCCVSLAVPLQPPRWG
jgi:hypothetical protein